MLQGAQARKRLQVARQAAQHLQLFELEPKLAEFERQFDTKAGEVGEELKSLGSEIKQRLLNIKEKLSD